MTHKPLFASLLATSAICLAVSSPTAAASTSDRAREAIAAAAARIHTAETMGADTAAPRETAGARATLAVAREDFKSDDRESAIDDAIRASAMADTAIGLTQQHKDAAIAAAREDQRATADSARDQIAAAQSQAAAAQDQAAQAQDQRAAAQQQAAEANARAQSAEQSAAASAADAAAARDAAATVAAQTPPPPVVQTTVTTHHATAVHHYVHHKAAPAKPTATGASHTTADDSTTTTTTVTPQPQP
jgi:hypothetical protein